MQVVMTLMEYIAVVSTFSAAEQISATPGMGTSLFPSSGPTLDSTPKVTDNVPIRYNVDASTTVQLDSTANNIQPVPNDDYLYQLNPSDIIQIYNTLYLANVHDDSAHTMEVAVTKRNLQVIMQNWPLATSVVKFVAFKLQSQWVLVAWEPLVPERVIVLLNSDPFAEEAKVISSTCKEVCDILRYGTF